MIVVCFIWLVRIFVLLHIGLFLYGLCSGGTIHSGKSAIQLGWMVIAPRQTRRFRHLWDRWMLMDSRQPSFPLTRYTRVHSICWYDNDGELVLWASASQIATFLNPTQLSWDANDKRLSWNVAHWKPGRAFTTPSLMVVHYSMGITSTISSDIESYYAWYPLTGETSSTRLRFPPMELIEYPGLQSLIQPYPLRISDGCADIPIPCFGLHLIVDEAWPWTSQNVSRKRLNLPQSDLRTFRQCCGPRGCIGPYAVFDYALSSHAHRWTTSRLRRVFPLQFGGSGATIETALCIDRAVLSPHRKRTNCMEDPFVWMDNDDLDGDSYRPHDEDRQQKQG
jgi:hypothetical protein